MISLVAAAILQAPLIPADRREVTLGPYRPITIVEVERALQRNNPVFSLYAPHTATARGGGVRFLVWRREQGGRTDWARVTGCPGAQDILIELENMPLPQADVPLLGREDQQGPPTDGQTYRLWFRGGKWPDGYADTASVSTNFGTPLARWVDRFRQVMEPCWTAGEPMVRDPI